MIVTGKSNLAFLYNISVLESTVYFDPQYQENYVGQTLYLAKTMSLSKENILTDSTVKKHYQVQNLLFFICDPVIFYFIM